MNELAARISAEIDEQGPIPFRRFMERALYEPELGFYESSGQAGGRRGDFTTSVETGPLFAAIIGDWLDARWRASGEPERFVVAEAAAGVGTLWRGIHKSHPACFDALQWVLVERSAALRRSHDELPGTPSSVADLPERCDVVFANELLDNLVFDVAERTMQGWVTRHVARSDEGFVWTHGEVTEGGLPDDAPVGATLPVPVGALEWLDRARAAGSHVLLFDYAADDSALIDRAEQGWLRCYAGHERITDPLARPGSCDITHDVPIDRLPTPDRVSNQANWLTRHGLAERVAAAKDVWAERGHVGDLTAMFARSAIGEAEALTDGVGLGSFTVLEYGTWASEP